MMRYNTSAKIIGHRKMKLKMHVGIIKKLLEVRHILDLSRSLISMSLMTDGEVHFSCDRSLVR